MSVKLMKTLIDGSELETRFGVVIQRKFRKLKLKNVTLIDVPIKL